MMLALLETTGPPIRSLMNIREEEEDEEEDENQVGDGTLFMLS